MKRLPTVHILKVKEQYLMYAMSHNKYSLDKNNRVYFEANFIIRTLIIIYLCFLLTDPIQS